MYDYNYTVAVDLGYDATMTNKSFLAESSDDPIKCSSRDFNLTHYQSSVVTEVSTLKPHCPVTPPLLKEIKVIQRHAIEVLLFLRPLATVGLSV